MAPRKGETAFQKASRLTAQANIIQVRAAVNLIAAALKEHQQHIGPVLRLLVKHGALDPDSDEMNGMRGLYESAQAPTPAPAPAPASTDSGAGRSSERSQQLAPAEDAEAPAEAPEGGLVIDGGDDKAFDKNITTIGDLSITRLETVLQVMERISFSKMNLKTVVKRGARLANATFLGQLIEFCTNVPLDGEIPKNCRAMPALAKHLLELNESLGRRARDLALPIGPNTELVYCFKIIQPGEALITHRYRMTEVRLVVPSDGTFFIHASYSEARAQLRQRAGPFSQTLSVLFTFSDPLVLATPPRRSAREPSPRPAWT